jgi:membrane fusion protein, multidrug efflux system
MSAGKGARRLYVVALAWIVAATVGVGLLASRRSAASRAEIAARTHARETGPRIVVATASATPPQRLLQLQGEVHPFASVTLYAKVAGYLGAVRVDKGDLVSAGQLIATIVSPELSQQVLAARADALNKRRQAKRLQVLARPGVVSAQDVETAASGADVAEAMAASLRDQNAYRLLRAPFSGTITERFADPGALIQSATGGQSGALPVVTIADTARLRIYVYLDQSSAPFVKVGDRATIRTPERPGWSRVAKVARMSGELTARTRTMLTEIDMDNTDGLIVPGSFVEAEIAIAVTSSVEVPAEALVSKAGASFVAVVGADNRLHFRPVHLATDDGERARLLDGLQAGEIVALNVGESLEDGALIRPVPRDAARHGQLSSNHQ